ncbi:MAG: Fic family protein [Thermoplasmata archaeon]|nr:MAG: Fic family protein [Thermoplasmata archaeon]
MRKSILLALREELLDRCPLTALPRDTLRGTSALNTWGTNHIEGNRLSRKEVEDLLLRDRSPGGHSVRDLMETVQHDHVFQGLFGRMEQRIGAEAALELHALVFWRILPDAGKLRRVRVRVVGSPHRPPVPEWVPRAMMEWEDELEERVAGEVFATAAWMHHRFESIHPFTDGNGRTGRLLMNLYLLKHSWPPVHVLPEDRQAYMDTFVGGHQGDHADLERLLRVLMGRSLLLLLADVGDEEDRMLRVSELARDGPYTAKYLALRASQGHLPAEKRRGRWWTTRRAVGAYRQVVGKD